MIEQSVAAAVSSAAFCVALTSGNATIIEQALTVLVLTIAVVLIQIVNRHRGSGDGKAGRDEPPVPTDPPSDGGHVECNCPLCLDRKRRRKGRRRTHRVDGDGVKKGDTVALRDGLVQAGQLPDPAGEVVFRPPEAGPVGPPINPQFAGPFSETVAVKFAEGIKAAWCDPKTIRVLTHDGSVRK